MMPNPDSLYQEDKINVRGQPTPLQSEKARSRPDIVQKGDKTQKEEAIKHGGKTKPIPTKISTNMKKLPTSFKLVGISPQLRGGTPVEGSS